MLWPIANDSFISKRFFASPMSACMPGEGSTWRSNGRKKRSKITLIGWTTCFLFPSKCHKIGDVLANRSANYVVERIDISAVNDAVMPSGVEHYSQHSPW